MSQQKQALYATVSQRKATHQVFTTASRAAGAFRLACRGIPIILVRTLRALNGISQEAAIQRAMIYVACTASRRPFTLLRMRKPEQLALP